MTDKTYETMLDTAARDFAGGVQIGAYCSQDDKYMGFCAGADWATSLEFNQESGLIIYSAAQLEKLVMELDKERTRAKVLVEALEKIGGRELEAWAAMYEFIASEALKEYRGQK